MKREEILKQIFPKRGQWHCEPLEPPTPEDLHETTNMLLKQISVELANLRTAIIISTDSREQ